MRAVWLIGVLAALCLGGVAGHAQTNETPNLQEVYSLIRSHLTNLNEAELNRTAVLGLINQLKGQVILATNEMAGVADSTGDLVGKPVVFDDAYGYVRVARVTAGLGGAFDAAWEELRAPNKLKGLVIDLRFATGQDYGVVADVGGRFIEADQPLFRLGDVMVRSARKGDLIVLPIVVLVNGQTSGAAEVLAAILRRADAGLVIGAPTAGRAHPFRDFPLSNGQILKIASGTVELAGGEALTDRGLTPDIQVRIEPAEELAYLEDPYRALARGGTPLAVRGATPLAGSVGLTNRLGRRRLNEAELVRMQREGLEISREATAVPGEASRPVLQDPVLGRALDFLKGMVAVQSRR